MHRHFLQQAVDLAVENVANGGGPFAALIVSDGRLLVTGCNRVTASHDPTAHAEISAIRAACLQMDDFEVRGCTLYSSCEPCPMCLGAIYWARLDAVYYACNRIDASAAGFDDGFIYAELAKSGQERRIPMYQILLNSARQPFLAWGSLPDRVGY